MQTMMIGDLAKRSGLTERALRHYEKIGLLNPRRTQSRQRVYSYADILRLNEIQLLKRAGFTLSEIGGMLGKTALDARALLEGQKAVLEAEAEKLRAGVGAIEGALKAVEAGTPVNLSTLCQLIKLGEQTMSEEKWQKVWDKFYTEEERERWKAAKNAVPDAVVQEHQNMWPALIARTEELVAAGADPTSDEALEVVAEWNKMTQVVYDIDPKLAGSAAKLYDNMDAWPADGPALPFSKEVWAFIKEAGETLKASQVEA
ncbi:MerR family transcriptional regulator [Kordiimonas marina]|uniref:MerR family transcriptional regulator n=1 Tax=Kordiimonas marina TaxID=2872312 RepID=UPI001FF3E35C|nr:MerR family transcriptional regulator [Kordiimonas marina]MCJ9428096.1 MerR family transcriptional regulator [Kordiimonas marina]